jgi:hypothetical protein
MKYTKELVTFITAEYTTNPVIADLSASASAYAVTLNLLEPGELIPERSLIAKLSSLGVYQKKGYLTKRGEPPIKKGEHIEKLAELLKVNPEVLDSLEKVNKGVLVLLITALEA